MGKNIVKIQRQFRLFVLEWHFIRAIERDNCRVRAINNHPLFAWLTKCIEIMESSRRCGAFFDLWTGAFTLFLSVPQFH